MNNSIKSLLLFLSALLFSITSYCQTTKDSLELARAKDVLKNALADTTNHNINPADLIILNTKEKSIQLAEWILFDIYGKKRIKKQRPYKTHLIDGFWIIRGTLS